MSVAFGGQPALLPVLKQAGFTTAFDTGGTTVRGDSQRSPLLRLDMNREYRAVRNGYPKEHGIKWVYQPAATPASLLPLHRRGKGESPLSRIAEQLPKKLPTVWSERRKQSKSPF